MMQNEICITLLTVLESAARRHGYGISTHSGISTELAAVARRHLPAEFVALVEEFCAARRLWKRGR
jgi:hypothetical protein